MHRSVPRSAVCAALALACVGAAKAPLQPDVFVLAGQSNMSGRGSLAELTAAERVPDPGLRLYGNDGRRRPALDPLDDAAGQIDAISADAKAAVGPGLTFARAWRARTGHAVVLVSCAKGGTSIGRWAPGGGRDTLYGSCLARIREAGGHLAGVLWYQGESDGEKTQDGAARWSGAFAAIIAAWRADLGLPRLPVAFVQIADKPVKDAARYPGWDSVSTQQARFRLPCTKSVPAMGLPRNPDELHLTTAAQRDLGRMLARAMAMLIADKCVPARP